MQQKTIAQTLGSLVADQGGRVYYVGGYVRDRILGAPNKDVDVEVHGITPQTLESILDNLGTRMEMGSSFGVYGLKGFDIDIAMPRQETATGRGHKDFKVEVDPFIGTRKAAMRRDFTCNAMMEDVLTGEVIDHFGGREDLKQGILRHVSDESFPEDALRVLRCAQFAARFQFTVAPETTALCRGLDLSYLPRERIFEEMRKALLKAEKPSIFFEVLREMDQLKVWFPEVEALFGVPQSPKFHVEGDVWTHTMMVLDAAAQRRDRVSNPTAFMLSALCHDFGKALCSQEVNGVIHAYGHEAIGLPEVKRFLSRLTSEKSLIHYVLNMTELHMKPNKMAEVSSVKAMNRLFDQSVEPSDLVHLAVCDEEGRIQETPRPSKEPLLRQRLEVFREYMARPCVMGADLVDAGLKPGKEFHDLLILSHKLHLAGIPKEDALRQVLAQVKK